jgi:hypothetical protein
MQVATLRSIGPRALLFVTLSRCRDAQACREPSAAVCASCDHVHPTGSERIALLMRARTSGRTRGRGSSPDDSWAGGRKQAGSTWAGRDGGMACLRRGARWAIAASVAGNVSPLTDGLPRPPVTIARGSPVDPPSRPTHDARSCKCRPGSTVTDSRSEATSAYPWSRKTQIEVVAKRSIVRPDPPWRVLRGPGALAEACASQRRQRTVSACAATRSGRRRRARPGRACLGAGGPA